MIVTGEIIFYLNFIIVVLVVLIVLWISMWLYRIYEVKHSAQGQLGKLIRFYDKRHELIERFLDKKGYISPDLSEKISRIVSYLNTSKRVKDIYEKLKIEHEISEVVKSMEVEFDKEILIINEEIHKIAEEYNMLVDKITSFNRKIFLKPIFKILKISLLKKIEV